MVVAAVVVVVVVVVVISRSRSSRCTRSSCSSRSSSRRRSRRRHRRRRRRSSSSSSSSSEDVFVAISCEDVPRLKPQTSHPSPNAARCSTSRSGSTPGMLRSDDVRRAGISTGPGPHCGVEKSGQVGRLRNRSSQV